MKKDIQNRQDLLLLLEQFYTKAFADPLIGRFFTEVVPLDKEIHIPLIADFWESVLFGSKKYSRNVMDMHRSIDNLSKIRGEHLDRWVMLLHETVDDLYEGATATLMKHRARSIATLMDIKFNSSTSNPFL